MKIIPKKEELDFNKYPDGVPPQRKLVIKTDVNNGLHKIEAPGPFVPPVGMLVDLAGFRYRIQAHRTNKGEITLRAIGNASKLKRFPLHQAILMRFQDLKSRWFGKDEVTETSETVSPADLAPPDFVGTDPIR